MPVYGIPKWTKLCRRNKHRAVKCTKTLCYGAKRREVMLKMRRHHAQNAVTSCPKRREVMLKMQKHHAQNAETSYRDVMCKMQTKVMLKMQTKVMLKTQRRHAQNTEMSCAKCRLKSCSKCRNVIQRCHAQNAD